MISIGAPYVTNGKYSPFLCEERRDAFLIGFLPHAMQFRRDFQCDAPVTKRLREQLEECFLLPWGKCKRTLLELEALDAVDKFDDVFDVEWYNSHRREYMLEYYSGVRRCEVYAMELQPLLHHKFKMLCLGDRLWIYLHYWGMAAIVSILRNRFIRNLWHFVRDKTLQRRKNA